MFNEMVVLPVTVKQRVLRKFYSSHLRLNQMKTLARRYTYRRENGQRNRTACQRLSQVLLEVLQVKINALVLNEWMLILELRR
ncbi:unnamed protein product [Hymenolepis diminuta]|uniref:Uncharacterized protein n=1 Tax=Hymenolepis diminuta TaxID=6216 RepID=A0A564YR15_HYMDI|nr:unnamed protein product [Hymenolepis diminuta]